MLPFNGDIRTINLGKRDAMTLKSRLFAGAIGVALLASLTACGASGAAPSPTPGPAPTSNTTPTPSATPAPTKDDSVAIKAAGEELFSSLPEAPWKYSYTAQGASATLDNVLNIGGLKAWAHTLEAKGWKYTPTQDDAKTLVGYLTKDDKVISVLAATNPTTAVATTAVFYYSDAAWTGTSTQS